MESHGYVTVDRSCFDAALTSLARLTRRGVLGRVAFGAIALGQLTGQAMLGVPSLALYHLELVHAGSTIANGSMARGPAALSGSPVFAHGTEPDVDFASAYRARWEASAILLDRLLNELIAWDKTAGRHADVPVVPTAPRLT